MLRFYAYFTETVPEGLSAEGEGWRTRRVVVLFHLADDTLQVGQACVRRGSRQSWEHAGVPGRGWAEACDAGPSQRPALNSRPGAAQLESGRTQENADGLEHGTLLRRHRAQRADGSPVEAASLAVGGTLSLHGWTLQLVDADAFTRDFLAARGLPQPPALPYPVDPIQLHRAHRAKPSGLSRRDPESPSRHAEALMGKASDGRKLQQFLEHSNQVGGRGQALKGH